MEAARLNIARAGRSALRSALEWPLVGWLLRSWLDDAAPHPADVGCSAFAGAGLSTVEPEEQPDESLRHVMGMLEPPTRSRRRQRLRHAASVTGLAAVIGLVPAAVVGSRALGAPDDPPLLTAPVAASVTSVAQSAAGSVTSTALAAGGEMAVRPSVTVAQAQRLAAAWPASSSLTRSAGAGVVGPRATLRTPLNARAVVPAPTQKLTTYTAQPGDALWTVAQRFGLSPMTVWWANDLPNKDFLRRGQVLTLPASSGLVHVVTDGETLDSIATDFRVSAEKIAEANDLVAGVVILGQRLFIPNGHGPAYQPIDNTDASPLQITLRPREARRGVIPSAGPAIVAGAVATAPSAAVAKVMIPGAIATVVPSVSTGGATAGLPPGTGTTGGTPGSNDPPGASGIIGSTFDDGAIAPGTIATISGGSSSQPTLNQPTVTVNWRNLSWLLKDGATVGLVTGIPTASGPDTIGLPPTQVPGDGTIVRVVVDLAGLFTTQFDGSAFASANCNMAAAAMLYEVQTGIDATGAQMRTWSGATSRGTSLDDLAHAFATQGQPVSTRYGMPWRTFVKEVAKGRSAVVQGWYGTLPHTYDLQPGFTAGHSVFVLGYSSHAFGGAGGFYVMDPLGRGDYTGTWWPASVLHTYGWSGDPNASLTTNHFFGYVALQATPSAKKLGKTPVKPVFQNFWETTKAAIEQALQVTVASPNGGDAPAVRGAVVLIEDPRLTLTARQAEASRSLAWPVAGGHVVRGFSRQNRALLISAAAGTAVKAAADGRVVYESWKDASGNVTIWVEHGPGLFTTYSGLGKVSVKPGQWVSAGDVLGSLSGHGASGKLLRFSVSVNALPGIAAAAADPLKFLGAR